MNIAVKLAAILAACGNAAAQDSWYSVPLSTVEGMSRDGLVLVGRSANLAATWTAASGVAILPLHPGESGSASNAASHDGSVIVGSMTVQGTLHAFRYTAAAGKQQLGPLPPGYHSPEAKGVSADGSVIVGLIRGSATQGFVWTQAEGMSLFTHPNYTSLELKSVSADGTVYMGNGIPASGGTCSNAFIWTEASGIDSPGSGCIVTNPSESIVGEALSDDGQAVVGTWSPFRYNGYIWRRPASLQVIMGTAGNHYALGVNHDGSVVVGVTASTNTSSFAGIWRQGTGVQHAQAYFMSLGISIPLGYSFQGAAVRHVSADARAFVIENIAQPSQGFAYVGPCPGNCDGSTIAPRLSPNDFLCFMNLYAAGDTRANCDSSTGSPGLTAADFICFLNRYAAGCP